LVILGVDSNTARLDPGAAPLPSPQGTSPAQASSPPPIPPGTSLPGSGAAATALGWAFREIGVPYSWGGGDATGPTGGFAQGADTVGFDCSGLTLFAWAHAGVALGHYTGSQWTAGRHVAQSDLQPGDLVFFATDTADPATIHHVGLYIGGGDMISAPHTGDVVRVELPLCQPPAPSAESASSASFGPRASDRGLPGCACQPVSRTAPM